MPTAQRFCPTAILFGSAARRCSWENRIFCYQMTVLIEALLAKTLSCESGLSSRLNATRADLAQVVGFQISGNSVKVVMSCGGVKLMSF